MSSVWHFIHKKQIFLAKNGSILKAEGHFKDGAPMIEWVMDLKPYTKDEKEYIVVSVCCSFNQDMLGP